MKSFDDKLQSNWIMYLEKSVEILDLIIDSNEINWPMSREVRL